MISNPFSFSDEAGAGVETSAGVKRREILLPALHSIEGYCLQGRITTSDDDRVRNRIRDSTGLTVIIIYKLIRISV